MLPVGKRLPVPESRVCEVCMCLHGQRDCQRGSLSMVVCHLVSYTLEKRVGCESAHAPCALRTAPWFVRRSHPFGMTTLWSKIFDLGMNHTEITEITMSNTTKVERRIQATHSSWPKKRDVTRVNLT
jgi:hypothetical protein